MDDKDDDFDQWLPGGLIDRSLSDIAKEKEKKPVDPLDIQKESTW